MALHVALRHVTAYRYDRTVAMGPQIVRLRPAPHSRTPILAYSLRVHPAGHFLNWQQDPQGNWLARIVLPEPVDEFRIEVDLVADMAVINPFDFFLEPSAEQWPFEYEPTLARELRPFLEVEPAGPRLQRWLDAVPRERRQIVDKLVALNQALQDEIRYVIRLEPGVQTPEETLESRRGSCRDSAWLLVQILRHLGLAARFVSGYLIQLVADVKALDGPSGPAADFTDLHAWTEVYLPGAGWVGLDPTSGLMAGEGHIPLASSPEPSSAAPISGGLEPCEVEFRHEMSVRRVLETPRATAPYSETDWEAILSAGDAVEARLQADDVRLTMGGEPTFVAAADPDAPEWNTEAVGPTKRRLADALARRLLARYAPGGLLHYGQGKWYPGEPLPRWAFGIQWRRDGVPLWQEPDRVAREGEDQSPTVIQARRLSEGVATRLGLDPAFVTAAYEDPLAVLQREGAAPENLPLADERIDDPTWRTGLARAIAAGVSVPVAFVLPVQRAQSGGDHRPWLSEVWRFRAGRLLLVPGDSPVGFRLPLKALPWVPEAQRPTGFAADPFEARAALPPRRQPRGAPPESESVAATSPGASNDPNEMTVRTALTVEPRDGCLCVFLPPMPAAEDYAELLRAVEDTAAEMDVLLHLEGYPPPRDARLAQIQVTPDPGVIEVNVHPTSSWRELVTLVTTLYDDARHSGLAAEKFMLDGRHTGTGGGDHATLGGATAADSPFLRRPDLLRSLVTCWQHHPSLSYLFAGLFIGPTSQHPRVDEARHESLAELELAFRQIPEPGPSPPWLVDRLFRHLLTDVTGNTHRTEICIDKLFSPDSPSGRQGLVELRAFEMQPHAHMSLAQKLLIRALIASFWRRPLRRPLVRWGTALHDRFMLPHFLFADLRGLLDELREDATMPGPGAIDLRPEWYRPHLEFRCPVLGQVRLGELELELRQALEPWPVLGEEGAVGGTTRFVDSSLERVQVRLSGAVAERHVVLCNGHRVPLVATGVSGESVGGVRFRAWQPPSCLHPTIPAHAPLVFDVFDVFTGRSLGGCSYHVAHPGGRNFERFPVNANEAECRRRARFFPFGFEGGRLGENEPMTLPPLVRDDDSPVTLDLRWAAPGAPVRRPGRTDP